MALTINTNIASLQAQNALRLASEALAKNQLRLSTGLRINSAADDAAGMSISKRMTAQIRGLDQAIRNAYDGISMMQTAEGNLDEMMNILQRMRELAVQASNALTDSDRQDLNQEYQLKLQELDRIVQTAEFNGIKLLDGTAGKVTFQVGPNTSAANKIQVDLSTSLKSSNIGATNEFGGILKLKTGHAGEVAIADGSLGVNGIRLNVSPYVTRKLNTNLRDPGNNFGYYVIEKGHGADSAYAIAQAINNSNAGVNAHAKTIYTSPNTAISVKKTATISAASTGTYTLAVRAYAYYTLRINNFTVFSNYKISAVKTVQTHLAGGSKLTVTATVKLGASTIAAAINKMAETLGVTAQVTEGGKLKLYNPDGGNIKITERAGTEAYATNNKITGNFKLVTFANVFDLKTAKNNTVKGLFINNQNLVRGSRLIATKGFTGSTNDPFAGTKAPNHLTIAGGGAAAYTVVRGTLTLTAPSAFKFTDYWENNETYSKDLGFYKVTTSGGATVSKGKADFTRLTNRTTNTNITTNGGRTADGYVYYFSAPAQQMFLKTTNILTVSAAQKAIDRIDQAINDLNNFRAKLGATQNRFQSTINNLNNYVQKLVDARSRILDADVAKEAAQLVQNNIKRQAAAAILAQANQNPALALQLLGGM